jgi:hypothetical protein
MSFLAPQPDLASFAAAQAYLRAKFGRDVRFYSAAQMTFDPSIPQSEFDDEGIPIDPLLGATPTNPADVEIPNLTLTGQARCNVLFQPLAAMRRDEVEEQAIGIRSRLNKDLILDIADKPQADGATHFQIGTQTGDSWVPDEGELWKIVNAKTDGFGALQRYIVFGQGTR